jgi:hypothetical protein
VQKNNIFQRDHEVLRIGLSRKDPHSPQRKFPPSGGEGEGGVGGGVKKLFLIIVSVLVDLI